MKLVGLFYVNQGDYIPLPEWAHFFIGLGEEIATARKHERRLIFAAALPTRAYVAALTALGVVRTLLTEPPSEKDIAEVWRKTNVGTPVIVQEGTRRVRGEFCGLRRFTEDNRLRVGVFILAKKREHLTRWFLPERCVISSLPSGATMVLPEQGQGNEILKNQHFITGFVPQENLNAMLTRSHLGCLIVGHLNILRTELRDTIFAVGPEVVQCEQGKPIGGINKGDGHFDEGTMQDVLRVRKFSSLDQTFMTDVFPIEARTPFEYIKDCEDSVIIFDGATAFLRWRSTWTGNARVVLLDRTDSHFEEAVHIVNSDYIVRAGEPVHFNCRNLPSSVETVSFLGG